MRGAHDFAISNESSGYILAVPSWEKDPVKRIRDIHYRMDILKKSYEPESTYNLGGYMVFPWLGRNEEATNASMRRSYGAITNVPGPNKRFRWGTVEIERIYPLMMATPNGIGCSISSYVDHMMVGLTTDKFPNLPQSAVFSPGMAQEVADLFYNEFWNLRQHCDEIARDLVDDVVRKVGLDVAKNGVERMVGTGNGVMKEAKEVREIKKE